jgi:hypothetical protein
MTSVIITLCLCSSFSASLGFGAFSRGVIPGTEPHYLKVIQADRAKKAFDPVNSIIPEIKDKFLEPDGARMKIKEDVKIEDIKSFMKEKVGKERCEFMLKELNEVNELINIESKNPPSTVFALSGNKEKSGILYEYMNITEKDLEIGADFCGLIKS